MMMMMSSRIKCLKNRMNRTHTYTHTHKPEQYECVYYICLDLNSNTIWNIKLTTFQKQKTMMMLVMVMMMILGKESFRAFFSTITFGCVKHFLLYINVCYCFLLLLLFFHCCWRRKKERWRWRWFFFHNMTLRGYTFSVCVWFWIGCLFSFVWSNGIKII